MEFKQALAQTQSRLSQEGSDMGLLFEQSKSWTTETLVGENEWKRIVACTKDLPITMGTFPFGFEFPLHTRKPQADIGVTLKGVTSASKYFLERAKHSESDLLAGTIANLFKQIEDNFFLRSIVDQKVMMEFDVGSVKEVIPELPGFFLYPGMNPISGGMGKVKEVLTVADALYSCAGWKLDRAEKDKLEQIYLAQPNNTRMDSFGIFPSRSRGIRLAVMGLSTATAIDSFLKAIEWPGDTSIVQGVAKSLHERVQIVQSGVNLDVNEEGLGSTLGLTAIVKLRHPNDPQYWLDDTNLWTPFLDALGQEEIVVKEKLEALKGWMSMPTILYGNTGRFVVLRGIHHIKLVISEGALSKVKAYVFMVFTTADNFNRR